MSTNWEYQLKKFDAINVDKLQNQLNALGADGWELCGVDNGIYIFKKNRFAYDEELMDSLDCED